MSWKDSITIIEPQWGQKIMLSLNDFVTKHELLRVLVPFTADVFVFTYPVYLFVLYLWGIGKRKTYYKEAALYVFFASVGAAVINYVIQYFGDKSRPELALENKEFLLLDHIPTDPFPSDHAAVSAAIAMSTMLWGLKYKDKTFLRLSLFFWFASGVMCVSRVAVAVHRPTDIIVGVLVGIIVSLLLMKAYKLLKRKIIAPLIKFEEYLTKNIFKIK